MKSYGSHRLWLLVLAALFGGTLGLAGCSSNVKKVGYEASVNPNDEVQKLDQDIKEGFSNQYDILATKDFTQAQEYLAKAKGQISRESKTETVLSTLGYARGYLNKAKERTDSLQERTRGIIEARLAALNAGVRNYPDLASGLKKQDDEVRSEISDIESGQIKPARWASLQRGYLDLELKAIQASKLNEAKAQIYGAIKNGAKKNAPKTLAQAQRDVQNAESVIATDRHDENAMRPSIEKAVASARLLVEVLSATKRPEGVINEEAAMALVMSGRNVTALDEQLDRAKDQSSAQIEQIEKQGQQLKNTDAELRLNKALETARKKFNSEEADVYRQGDKLLIRLKSVNFSIGRADLPTKSLPLLAKVKTIAEELNPEQIVVQGHTDSTGKAQTNVALSQERAEAVASYLGNNGLDKDKIQAIGYGYDKPLTSNKSKQGRAQNRRVDVIITPTVQSATDSQSM